MAGDRHSAHKVRKRRAGAHRKSRQRGTALAGTAAAGGAAVCIGAASYFGVPSADALSVLLPGPGTDGAGGATRINILEGNVFNPQIGAGGNNSSTNMIIGGAALNRLYGFVDQLLSIQINLSGTDGSNIGTRVNIVSYNVFNPQVSLTGTNIANNVKVGNVTMDNGNNAVAEGAGGPGNGNTAQFSFLSGNIFNPQTSLTGANISNNVTVTNVAMNNGNGSVAMAGAGGLLPFLSGGAGNGNATQFSLLSGNIFNPQTSLTGANISNNVTVTNVTTNNGNGSQATTSTGNPLSSFVFGGGNGNSYQYGSLVSNISNPQWTWGGGNTSNNSAFTNTADGNGNGSTNTVTGGGSVVTGTGNGNTNQAANGSGNIYNDQVNIGPGGGGAGGSTTAGATDLDDVISLVSASRTERSATTGGTGRINRQSQQERRNVFSLNRITGRTPARNTPTGNTSTDNGGQPSGQPSDAGVTGGGSVGTGNGEAGNDGGDGDA